MDQHFHIRQITPDDATSSLKIYEPYVLNTNVTLEYETPDLEEWTRRIIANTTNYPWLVCTYKNNIIGYAYGSRHRHRAAYSWSVETTIYFSDSFHGFGIAQLLYQTLFQLLVLQGYINVYAGVILPNIRSERFHEKLGFSDVGIFRRIAFKFEKWHDTRWFQLHLIEPSPNPSLPKKRSEVETSKEFIAILDHANGKLMMGPTNG